MNLSEQYAETQAAYRHLLDMRAKHGYGSHLTKEAYAAWVELENRLPRAGVRQQLVDRVAKSRTAKTRKKL